MAIHAASFKASLGAGLGYDSNAFRSPGSSYTDYSAAGNPVVNPNEQSGFFIPLEIDASLNNKLTDKLMFKGDYSFNGDKYLGSDLNNADVYDHVLKLGGQFTITNTQTRSSHVYAGLRYADHQQTYADRDTGDQKTTSNGTTNISDLYSYAAMGVELSYDYKQEKSWELDLSYRQEPRDYTTPLSPGVEQDHDYSKLAATIGHGLGDNWKVEFDMAQSSRDYDFRHAHDADGTFSTVLLTYDYTDLGVTLKQEVSNKLKMSYGYAQTQRTDNNVGYNDYDLTEFTLGARYDMRDWLTFKGKLAVWNQDYPNAYNFDLPAQGAKSADGTTLTLKGNIERSKTQDWWAEMEVSTNNNSDPRYDYARNTLMAGVTWKF
jgi:hypothetical protein